ncbi:DUF4176 domain-containing protein [Chordicoccus furentiruminis]|uniref:DUF4176 domain-containing protein n=1 Tax=Chordicoccus furentiruminis TaxID=2709410 RepID=UPI0023A80B4F|nr:DUF4176 domain-containing protein [Chordicoccus furentiruminis]
MNTILPIGSVVMLKGAKMPLMIFGYVQQFGHLENEFADYIGVPYPAGNISIESQIGFQMTDIEKVLFEGYRDPSFAPFEKMLKVCATRHAAEMTEKGKKDG